MGAVWGAEFEFPESVFAESDPGLPEGTEFSAELPPVPGAAQPAENAAARHRTESTRAEKSCLKPRRLKKRLLFV